MRVTPSSMYAADPLLVGGRFVRGRRRWFRFGFCLGSVGGTLFDFHGPLVRFATPAVGFQAERLGEAGAAGLLGRSLVAEQGALGAVETALQPLQVFVLLGIPVERIAVFLDERKFGFVVAFLFEAQEPVGFGGAQNGLFVGGGFGMVIGEPLFFERFPFGAASGFYGETAIVEEGFW